MTTQFHRRTLLTSTLGLGALAVLSACTGTSSLPSVSTSGASGQPSTSPGLSPEVYDALVLAGPVAADSLIAASPWAQAIKAQGYLRRGGAETSAIFSLKDPTAAGSPASTPAWATCCRVTSPAARTSPSCHSSLR